MAKTWEEQWRKTLCATGLVCVAVAAASAEPAFPEKTGVQTLATVPAKTTLPRGLVFTISGAELGPAEAVTAEYGQELEGVTVTLTTLDVSATVQAYLVHASDRKITAILPSPTPEGDYNVTVTFNGESSDPFQVSVAERNYGLVTNSGIAGGTVLGRTWLPTEKRGHSRLGADRLPGAFQGEAGGGPDHRHDHSAPGVGRGD